MDEEEKLFTKIAFQVFKDTVFQKNVLASTVSFETCSYVKLSAKELRLYKKMSNPKILSELRDFHNKLKVMITYGNPHKDKKLLLLTDLRYLKFNKSLEVSILVDNALI